MPEDYVPTPEAELRRDRLRRIWNGLEKMGNLKLAHYVNATVRRDGEDHHFEADWLKDVPEFLPRPEDLEESET